MLSLAAITATTLLAIPFATAADTDSDGIDAGDNCPTTFNPLQDDCNGDGQGDACDVDAGQNDTDRDHVCQAVDNCATTPNTDQRDGNNNGVGDMCEAAWGVRDDDGDGLSNAIDAACPFDASATCNMQAVTVPWVPANPSIPHPTVSGLSHTLKGIARYGATHYMWDYGDGTPAMAWTAITNPYNLGVSHTYSGAVGQTFIATLSVRSSANPTVVASAIYRVKIADTGGAIPNVAVPPFGAAANITQVQMDPNRMDVRIDMAIDQGLWYLHTQMTRTDPGDAAPYYSQPYGLWGGNFAGVCTALDAFLLHGSKPNKDYAADPYVETTQRALNYILANSSAGAISNQTYGNPDYNLNGQGLVLAPVRGSDSETYVGGICAVAVASSGTPTRQALVGPAAVRGRTYKDIAQDMVEWFAWGQADTNWGRGGWHYRANRSNGTYGQTADGSTNQWPMLAIAAAEDNMAVKTPAFVRSEAPNFMNYTRNTAANANHGGWGYDNASDYVNLVKTASGIIFHDFEGDSMNHVEVKTGLGFIYRNWLQSGGWFPGLGNSYTMYGIMKAMRKPQPDILRVTEFNYTTNQQTANSFDWYYTPPGQTQEGIATNLVKRQAANGSWSDVAGSNNGQSGAFATGWDILILSKGVTIIPPQAAIANCGFTWNTNQSVTMDGSPSTHPDLNRHIVSYEWDFNYNGTTFDVDATGVLGTKAAGYSAYGFYPIALRVTDDNPIALGGPQTSIATCNIQIKAPNNCPHPDAGGPYLATHDESFVLDASATTDPDNDFLTYEWDLNNDGIFGDAVGPDPGIPANPAKATTSFSSLGTFSIAVKVTDTGFGGLDNRCSRIAYSTVEVGNHAPVADPGGPYTARPGQTIMLDGTDSSDPDADPILFGWDLNNDGTFSDSNLITPPFTVPANAVVGTVYSVCLKVTDQPWGRVSDPRCTTVRVEHVNTAPSCTLNQPAVVATCTGAGIQVTVDGSRSADIDNDPLTYAWTTDCPGGVFANPTLSSTTLTLSSGGACSAGCVATLTVRDDQGGVTDCTKEIHVVDQTDPTFSVAPANKTVECNGDTQAIVNAWLGSAAAGDECTTASVANDFQAVVPSCGATGSAHVTWTATDACGNDAQTEANLFIVDTTAPEVTCPAPVTVECAGRQTEVNLVATAVDACFGAVPVDGPFTALYPVGTSAAAFTAGDGCDRTGSCSTTVTVTDTTDPTIACPASQTVECNADHAATGVVAGTATGSDVCGDVTITGDAPAGGSYPLGTTTVTQTATDELGNDTSCASTITVADTTDPTLLCPADVVVECNAQGGANGVDPGAATATDVCTGATVTDPGVGTWPLGTNAAVHTAVDGAGNSTSCNNLVTVRDTTAPVFDPGSLAPRTVLGNCGGQAVSFTPPTATDVCQSARVTCGSVSGNSVGANTVTCTATDEAGNVSTTTITVNVLAPLRIAFHQPVSDDNVADDVATDADVANLFKVGSTIPHQMKLYSCSNVDVTAAVSSQVTLRLTETYRSGVGNAETAIVPEYSGVGDAGGLLVYNGSFFKYNLNTNGRDYPAGTSANAAYFSSLITATYNIAPWIVVAREDARLESR